MVRRERPIVMKALGVVTDAALSQNTTTARAPLTLAKIVIARGEAVIHLAQSAQIGSPVLIMRRGSVAPRTLERRIRTFLPPEGIASWRPMATPLRWILQETI